MGSCPSVCRVCMLVFAILGLFHLPSTLLKRDWKKLKSGPDDVDIIHGPWTSVSPAVFCAAALDRPGCFCHRRAWKYETARLGWHGSIFRDGHVSFATDETVSVLLDLTVVLLVGGCSNRRTEVQDAIWLWPLWIVWEESPRTMEIWTQSPTGVQLSQQCWWNHMIQHRGRVWNDTK